MSQAYAKPYALPAHGAIESIPIINRSFFWGLLAFIWLGVALWVVHPQGWLFMVLIAVFDLLYAIICVLGGSSWEAMASMIIISGLVLIYCLLPGTKQAFGIPP